MLVPTVWQPIVPRNNVEERVGLIARALRDHSDIPDQAGLLIGRAGVALFFLYYARFTGRQEDRTYSEVLVQDIFETLPDALPFTFCAGLAGVAWLLRHAQMEGLLDVDADEVLADVDDLLRGRMVTEMREGRFDFLHAALGCALYFLETADRPSSRDALAAVVDGLEHHAHTSDGRRSWPNLMAEFTETDGAVNLGMAHGMPSIISVLCRLAAAGIERDRCIALLNGATTFLLAQRHEGTATSCFGSVTGSAGGSTSRLAWCYGDPGVSVALWQAGRSRERADWSHAAVAVLQRAAARRLPPDTGVVDASLCHGSAGLALIFGRMHAETGDASLRDAARFWVDDTVARGNQAQGYAGYRAFFGEDGTADVATELSVLNGIAGVGLALMSLGTSMVPAWDRALLVS